MRVQELLSEDNTFEPKVVEEIIKRLEAVLSRCGFQTSATVAGSPDQPEVLERFAIMLKTTTNFDDDEAQFMVSMVEKIINRELAGLGSRINIEWNLWKRQAWLVTQNTHIGKIGKSKMMLLDVEVMK